MLFPMANISKPKIKFSPIQVLALGYFLVTVLGAILLSLPISSAKSTWQPFLDALFVSMSGISTSGLSVVDIGSYYSLFGQIVLMCIFQVGGIGYMTFFVFAAYVLGTNISIATKLVAKESLAADSYVLGVFFRNVLVYTLLFESIGAVILTLFWLNDFPFLYAIYLGVFHSVSAFCTAGFGIFSNSLMNYRESWTMNLTINIISIIGGLGFFVLFDLFNYAQNLRKKILPRRLTVHSKIVLMVTLIVMTLGTIVIWLSEQWPKEMNFFDKMLIASFQSISASTTDGFNSVDIGAMEAGSLTMLMILMFIGASPGSTGGGMKTTTLGTIFFSITSYLRNKNMVAIFKRKLSSESILKAFILFSLFVLILFVDLLILGQTEKASFQQIMFEIVSALGNTGLSTGITSSLSAVGKIILIITMFLGRVGPLTVTMAIIKKAKPLPYSYAQENIFIG